MHHQPITNQVRCKSLEDAWHFCRARILGSPSSHHPVTEDAEGLELRIDHRWRSSGVDVEGSPDI
ncbi:hypothetical protein SNOG_20138 [Parastagonospora nodorum SN15]|uniref:Uncharacterized protein n=1 Tax=Phaeosphaeria nodorum (strain SN15 / ATCC MYA-4574 / FGSC 10173) TaxID=321614 RepID=A9JXD4_PHANO|nr:hypothetical protein SNOG_20138 [Parastagonospora nodorum SN15]EDP89824.1 hypothetical protein SNOG_20138 [Parastagonospora nodorum SN15]